MAEYQIYTSSESENESEILKLNQASKRRRYKNRQKQIKRSKIIKLKKDKYYQQFEPSSPSDNGEIASDHTDHTLNVNYESQNTVPEEVNYHIFPEDPYIYLGEDIGDDIFNDDSSTDELETSSIPFVEQLKKYANKYALNCVQVNELLKLIHKNIINISNQKVINVNNVPKTYKTLFNISNKKLKNQITTTTSNHKLYYFGLANQIKFYLKQYPVEILDALQPNNTLELIWNTDGMQLYQSKDECAWPILCYIRNLFPRKVFEVLLTTGRGKPNIEFLKQFIEELRDLMLNGLNFTDNTYKKRTFTIKHIAAVCDGPARSFIKCILGHGGYHSCEFCTILGKRHEIEPTKGNGKDNINFKMTYQGSEIVSKRTDKTFRSQEHERHHKGESPLLQLDIDMIQDFPIDFMHSSGGTMRRLFDCWLKSPKRTEYRMTCTNIKYLNARIEYISSECLPNIFPRRLRITSQVNYYKFAEHKQFLLYTGKILLLNLMPAKHFYDHFLKYSFACSLMNDAKKATFLPLAQNLIMDTIDSFQSDYGAPFMVYVAHCNIHFPDIVKHHGSLSAVSAFPFENHLRHLRKWVSRSSHQAMISMINGVLRRQSVECTELFKIKKSPIYFKSPNNVYIDVNSKIEECYVALEKTMDGKCVKLECYYNPMSLYSNPIDSKLIGCYKINPNQMAIVTKTYAEVESFRRGFKICLDRLVGIEEDLKPYWVIHVVGHDEDEGIFS